MSSIMLDPLQVAAIPIPFGRKVLVSWSRGSWVVVDPEARELLGRSLGRLYLGAVTSCEWQGVHLTAEGQLQPTEPDGEERELVRWTIGPSGGGRWVAIQDLTTPDTLELSVTHGRPRVRARYLKEVRNGV